MFIMPCINRGLTLSDSIPFPALANNMDAFYGVRVRVRVTVFNPLSTYFSHITTSVVIGIDCIGNF